jgi:hypothetical protein
LLLLGDASATPAGPVASWSYSAAVGAANTVPSSTSYAESGGTFQDYGETDYWVLYHTNNGNLPDTSFQGSQSVLIANVSAAKVVPSSSGGGQGYNYSLLLTDRSTGSFEYVYFSGLLGVKTAYTYQPNPFGSGSWPVPAGSQLVNTFTRPTTQSIDLGPYRYTVTFSFAPGSGPGWEPPSGQFRADVQVSSNPEPAGVVLAGLGLVGTTLAAWRRRARVRGASTATCRRPPASPPRPNRPR